MEAAGAGASARGEGASGALRTLKRYHPFRTWPHSTQYCTASYRAVLSCVVLGAGVPHSALTTGKDGVPSVPLGGTPPGVPASYLHCRI